MNSDFKGLLKAISDCQAYETRSDRDVYTRQTLPSNVILKSRYDSDQAMIEC